MFSLNHLNRVSDLITKLLLIVALLLAAHYCRRIFIAEKFFIPTSSMEPTLAPGNKVWVNKLIYGARIYKSFKFEDHAPLKCFRMPGIRKIDFKINYVYCKRVVGVPGDTIGIKDGIVWNSNYKGTIGVLENQMIIHDTPDSILWRTTLMATMPFTRPIWTIKNFGPLYIPEKGVTIELDSIGRAIYGPVIEYETGAWPADNMTYHTFQHNYYFALGDNSISSQDSRYWGFIPEDFIIGVVGGKRVKNDSNQTLYVTN